MKRFLIACALFSLVMAPQAMAHNLWINSFESDAHQPGHALVSLGWGHGLPMDDILNGPSGKIRLESFQVLDPKGVATNLIKPGTEIGKPAETNANFDLFSGDVALQKLAFKEKTASGTYQLAAVTMPAFYTKYIDTKGRTRMKMKPQDELKNIQKVLMSVKYQAFAKAYITKGAWKDPEPLGHGLEIIPVTDLSKLAVGDLVRVKVLFHGKPLTTTAKRQEYVTVAGTAFGQKDGYSLFSHIKKGQAQFRVHGPGQWRIVVKHKDDVTADGPLKNLAGKAEQVYHAATLTFTVQ